MKLYIKSVDHFGRVKPGVILGDSNLITHEIGGLKGYWLTNMSLRELKGCGVVSTGKFNVVRHEIINQEEYEWLKIR